MEIQIRDLVTGKLVNSKTARRTFWSDSQIPNAASFGPDGNTLAIGFWVPNSTGCSICLLDSNTLVEKWQTDFPIEPHVKVTDIDFSPDGTQIATSFNNRRSKGTSEVRVLNAENGTPFKILRGHESIDDYFNGVFSVAYSPDGALLATGGGDTTIRIWETKTWEQIATVGRKGEHGSWVTALCFSPDGRFLASGGVDETILIWDTKTWEREKRIKLGSFIQTIVFSPDGSMLAAACNYVVKLWKVMIDEK